MRRLTHLRRGSNDDVRRVIIGGLIAERENSRNNVTFDIPAQDEICMQTGDVFAGLYPAFGLSGHNDAVVRDNEQEHCYGDRTLLMPAVLLGGVLGALLSQRLPEQFGHR